MAIGDDAAAAGLPVVPGTDPVREGAGQITISRDLLAQYAKRDGPLIDIHQQPTAPAHAPGRIWVKA